MKISLISNIPKYSNYPINISEKKGNFRLNIPHVFAYI